MSVRLCSTSFKLGFSSTWTYTSILHFSKFPYAFRSFIQLPFCERCTLVPGFPNWERYEGHFCFYQKKWKWRPLLFLWKKKWKVKSIQHLFCSELCQRQCASWASGVALPSSFPSNYTQRLNIKPTQIWGVCEHLCFVLLYLVVLGKMYFKGVASLLYIIFTYKRFHRKPQLSDSGRNMYLKLSFNLLFFTLFVLFSQIDFKFLNGRRLCFNFSTISYLFI